MQNNSIKSESGYNTHDDIGEIYVKTDSSYYHFAYLTVEEQVDILQYLENFYGKNK